MTVMLGVTWPEKEPVVLDLPKLVRTKLLVQANSGGGKSWAVRRLLEQTFGQIQHIVIDPEGEFASLREKFDYVLAAPSGGDTAIDVTGRRGEQHTKLLAHRLLELNASAILDIYELPSLDRARFVRIFLDAMVDAPKTLWHPVLIVLDEAHNFAPQNGDADSSKAVAAMSSKGRKRGFCLVPATQRISKLAKDVAAEANNKLIGRCSLDVDMKRAAEELGFTSKEAMQSLRRLEPGEFFAFGPALTYEASLVRIGPVVTTHPEAGTQIAAPPAPTAKIKALLPRLADLPAEAEHEAKTIEELRKELTDTRRKLTLAEKAQPTQRVEAPCNHARDIARLEAVIDAKEREVVAVRQLHAEAESELASVYAANDIIAAEIQVQVKSLRQRAKVRRRKTANVARTGGDAVRNSGNAGPVPSPLPSVKQPAIRQADPDSSTDLTGPEQRILNALAWWEAIGVSAPTKGNVGFIGGYRVGKKVGGNFGNVLGTLRARGLIDYPTPGAASLTDDGREAAQPPDAMPTTDALHEAIYDKLDGPERRVLEVLIDRYPDSLSKQDVGAEAGYAVGPKVGGNFGNILGRLRSLGLIDYPAPGTAVATALLFPEAM